MKTAKDYRNDPAYVTQTEAARLCGKDVITFKRYAERFGVPKTAIGKYTFYKKEDVEMINEWAHQGAEDLVRRIEQLTGKKVQLI